MSKIENITFTKLYYSIGEVATIFDVNTSLLRFWEKEFQLKPAKKNSKGNRLYSEKEIREINKIYELVKEQGFTLDGAKKVIKTKPALQNTTTLTKPMDKGADDILSKLEGIKAKLKTLKKS